MRLRRRGRRGERALHAFWNGAGFVEGARSLLYFDSTGFGGRILSLVLWLAAGALLMTAATVTEHRAAPALASPANRQRDTEEETAEVDLGEAVAA